MAAPVTIRNLRDAHVNQGQPTKNFVNTARLVLSAEGGKVRRSFLFFGKPWPAGATITSAKLRVWNVGTWAGSVTLTAHRLTEGWAGNKVNWNNQPTVAGSSAGAVTKTNAAPRTMWEMDITSTVQFVANGGAWFGLRLVASGDALKYLYSTQAEASEYRPQVIITWSDAPEPPENLSPAGGRFVAVPKPLLSYDFTDISGDVNLAEQQVQLASTETGFGAPSYDSGWQPTSVPEYDLNDPPAGAPAFTALADNTSIWWRARVRDGAGVESSWSAPAQFGYASRGVITSTSIGSRLVHTNLMLDPRNLSSTWTGLDATGKNTAAGATSPHSPVIAAAVGTQWTVAMQLKNNTSSVVTLTNVGMAPTLAGSFGSLSPVVPGLSVVLEAQETKTVYHTSTTPASSDGFRARFTVPAGAAIGAVTMLQTTVISGTYSGELFDGGLVDTPPIGPYVYEWTGTANNSTSTKSELYVEDSSPPILWTLTGRTQTAYRAVIQDLDKPDRPVFDTGKISGTTGSIDTVQKIISRILQDYRLTLLVWDNVPREKNANEPVPTVYQRDFIYAPGTTVTPPTDLVATPDYPFPWVQLDFKRTTPPDSFSIFRDNTIIENNIDPGLLDVGGTNYRYIDKASAPRVQHSYQVVANVNAKDSQRSNTSTATPKPTVTWMMNPDTSSPIALVKSASEPTPVVDAQSMSMQEIHQPVGGGSPVLITQFLSGFEGHVDAVLADEIVAGLSARTMRDRFKYWKRNPGTVVLLFMVDEVLRIVPYNMTYRPRAKGGNVIFYDVSFDFFEVD